MPPRHCGMLLPRWQKVYMGKTKLSILEDYRMSKIFGLFHGNVKSTPQHSIYVLLCCETLQVIFAQSVESFEKNKYFHSFPCNDDILSFDLPLSIVFNCKYLPSFPL